MVEYPFSEALPTSPPQKASSGNSIIRRGNHVTLNNGRQVFTSDGDQHIRVCSLLRCALSLPQQTGSCKTRTSASYCWIDPTMTEPTEQGYCKAHWEELKTRTEDSGLSILKDLTRSIPEENSVRRDLPDETLVTEALKFLKPDEGEWSAWPVIPRLRHSGMDAVSFKEVSDKWYEASKAYKALHALSLVVPDESRVHLPSR